MKRILNFILLLIVICGLQASEEVIMEKTPELHDIKLERPVVYVKREKELRIITEETKEEIVNKVDITTIDGKSSLEELEKKYKLKGDISHYGYKLHGSKTATGGRFDQWGMTAAHKSLPFGTRVKVTNIKTNKSVEVRINDRGPYIKGRTFDLSRGAFIQIAPEKQGIIKAKDVIIEVLSIGNGKRKENQ